MLSEILKNINSAYRNFEGDGKMVVLFLVALLFLFLCRKLFDFNPFALIASPMAAIGAAFATMFDFIKGKWMAAAALILTVFAITMTGSYTFADDNALMADNAYHIPDGYVEVMDYVLSQDADPVVLAMPDYCIYHSIYSSKFTMMFEKRTVDDVRYLPENVRDAYIELSGRNPDMWKLSKDAMESGCEFIILKKQYYWSEVALWNFDYELIKEFDGWEVYARRETANEE